MACLASRLVLNMASLINSPNEPGTYHLVYNLAVNSLLKTILGASLDFRGSTVLLEWPHFHQIYQPLHESASDSSVLRETPKIGTTSLVFCMQRVPKQVNQQNSNYPKPTNVWLAYYLGRQ